jgi:hypothetical protein
VGAKALRIRQGDAGAVKRPLPQAHDIEVGDILKLLPTAESDAQSLHKNLKMIITLERKGVKG